MSRIEHYATYLEGGAGAAALRIFDGILEAIGFCADAATETKALPEVVTSDWQLEFLCRGDQPLKGQQTGHFAPSTSFLNRTWTRKWNRKSFKQASQHYHEHLKNRPEQFEAFSPARLFEPTVRANRDKVDLIHLHWVAYLIDYLTFFRSIPPSTPIVWTLHDMNAFTGGCHYSAGCEKYKTGCGSCFQLDHSSENDLSATAWSQKKEAYNDRDFTVVAPSQWLTELAAQSEMFPPKTRFETIHYGLDTAVYQPVDQTMAKQELGLQANKLTLLFGAADLSVKRKGAEPLIRALAALPNPGSYECVIFGGGDLSKSGLSDLSGRIDVKEIGFLKSDEQKRVAYSAADIFLLPSLEDNQPQTGLESLACGTPVVAFDSGGIAEFVQHGKTGLLATVNDSQDLAKQIRWLAESVESQKAFGQNGRSLILEQFEIKQQTRRYLQLYQQILERSQRGLRRVS